MTVIYRQFQSVFFHNNINSVEKEIYATLTLALTKHNIAHSTVVKGS